MWQEALGCSTRLMSRKQNRKSRGSGEDSTWRTPSNERGQMTTVAMRSWRCCFLRPDGTHVHASAMVLGLSRLATWALKTPLSARGRSPPLSCLVLGQVLNVRVAVGSPLRQPRLQASNPPDTQTRPIATPTARCFDHAVNFARDTQGSDLLLSCRDAKNTLLRQKR